jgi:hypothetical protein
MRSLIMRAIYSFQLYFFEAKKIDFSFDYSTKVVFF